MRAAYFISDHGWGHLSRSTMVAAELHRRGHSLLMAVGPAMERVVREALPDAQVVTGELDRGYAIEAHGRGADAERTRGLLRFAVEADRRVLEAVVRWRPDVVIADATPWASTVGQVCLVPSVICSNFSWDDQYAALYTGDVAATAAVEAITNAVRAFSVALELPLGPGSPSVAIRRPMPLVSRRPNGAVLAVSLDRPLVTWAFGRTPPEQQPIAALRALGAFCAEQRLRLVVSETAVASGIGAPHTVVPDNASWPDLLAASRLVVTKAGYSTVAESLRGAAHVIAIGITGLPEERAMLTEIEAYDAGYGIPLGEADRTEVLVGSAAALLARTTREPQQSAGEEAVVDALENL